MASESEAEVPDPDNPHVVADDSFGGEPRLRGRRITVLDVYDRVETGGMAPDEFAETFRLDVADVYHALAYYHDHPEEMASHREARGQAAEEVRREIRRSRPDHVDPDG